MTALAAAAGAWCVRVHSVAGERRRGAGRRALGRAAAGQGGRGAGDVTGTGSRLLGLRAFGHHGVLDHERRDGQEFVVDAVLWVDTGAAAATDDLTLTADYSAARGQARGRSSPASRSR